MRVAHQSPPFQCAGFSLIELMVVVALVAIFASLAAPNMSRFVASQRVKTTAYDLATSLLLARSEALKRNQNVTVAPTDSTAGWAGGWQVVATKTGGTDTVATQSAATGVTFGASGMAAPASVVYSGTSGRPSAVAKFQLSADTTIKCVKVDLAGVTTTTNGACT
ncbi:GspH/FimT family pseudopilin [Curvibacter sp. APW13]|uniref:GspH/FimT family pseudopilin n=1 Tax=Curvibacter sp. APW13 TaxID=3077236 RepID=UPI0028DF0948|nr:GspH/FimT family pseudopilin [Curvibacter sp. APW13]MDT8990645.1 GspH/FimT family pseudopilin [Curvibacter sp. APW13]